jgi:hypothetical protein
MFYHYFTVHGAKQQQHGFKGLVKEHPHITSIAAQHHIAMIAITNGIYVLNAPLVTCTLSSFMVKEVVVELLPI